MFCFENATRLIKYFERFFFFFKEREEKSSAPRLHMPGCNLVYNEMKIVLKFKDNIMNEINKNVCNVLKLQNGKW